MADQPDVAAAFIEVAHPIVWAAVATVDPAGRPRSRVMHPVWEVDDGALVGWVGTDTRSPKVSQLAHMPFATVSYWSPAQATAVADCAAAVHTDDDVCSRAWHLFAAAPEPVGYDPATIPKWADGPTAERFAVVELRAWHVRVLDPTTGVALTWTDPAPGPAGGSAGHQ